MEHKDAVFKQNTVFFALNLAVYINRQFLTSYKDYITISL